MKRVGILEAGTPPASLAPVHGDYPHMIQRFLGEGYAYETYGVSGGAFPKAPDACDAYIITGSSADAYGEADWISSLKAFLSEVRGRAPLVGICFGHQIMAEAFGGRVARSDKGWGIGLHTYAVTQRRPWMDDAEAFSIPASHRDQIVETPSNAMVIAKSYFCPIAAIEYEGFPAISFQAHPEFDPEFARALIKENRDAGYTPSQAEAAMASLDLQSDNIRVRDWILEFIESHK